MWQCLRTWEFVRCDFQYIGIGLKKRKAHMTIRKWIGRFVWQKNMTRSLLWLLDRRFRDGQSALFQSWRRTTRKKNVRHFCDSSQKRSRVMRTLWLLLRGRWRMNHFCHMEFVRRLTKISLIRKLLSRGAQIPRDQ